MLAYYMFVNHGWRPGRVSELSPEEKILMTLFAVKEIRAREELRGGC